MQRLIPQRLQRWRRSGGATAATGTHSGTVSLSVRQVHTRAGVPDAAMARGTAGQPREALGGWAGRRTARPPAHQLCKGHAGGGPGTSVLADTRWGNRGWVHREFQMREDLPDHPALTQGGVIRSVPCCQYGQCAMSSAHTRLRSRALLQRGAPVLVTASSSLPCWRGVGRLAPRRWLCGARQPP
jgi:hypothetical protein